MNLNLKRIMLVAGLALAVSAIAVLILPVLATSGDYGMESGASGSSMQDKNATQTAVAVYLTGVAHQTSAPSATPTPTATPMNTPIPDHPTADPTTRRRG